MTFSFKPLFFLVIFSLFSPQAISHPSHLVVYRDFDQKGDENQVKGIVRALEHHIKDLRVEEFNVGKEADLQAFIKEQVKKEAKRPILLAVGEKTVNPLAHMAPLSDAITVHVSHMITADHPKLLGKVDFIVVPEHTLQFSTLDFTKPFPGLPTKFIPTIGVAHNRQSEQVDKIYQQEKAKIPPSKSYLGVILAGDAPTPEGLIKVFTQDNAQALARYIADHLKDRHLLVLNGPRTGKYKIIPRENTKSNQTAYPKEELEELKTAHSDGHKDYITQAFLDELNKRGISSTHITVFDFQFGSTPNHAMDLVLGALRATHSDILVPGESTSTISETIDMLPHHVIVYPNTAMNETHNAHVKSEFLNNRIQVLTENFQSVPEKDKLSNPHQKAEVQSASEMIAKLLSDTFSKALISHP